MSESNKQKIKLGIKDGIQKKSQIIKKKTKQLF